MRQFVVLGHEAPVEPGFPLKDLPGAAGRLDVLCRCVQSAFFLSHDLRRDVRLFLVHSDEVTIRFEGDELKYLNPDERSTAARIRGALETYQSSLGEEERKSSPGIFVSPGGFGELMDEIAGDSTVVWLHEEGEPVAEAEVPDDPLFVLSDHLEFTDDELEVLEGCSDEKWSLGPESIHSDHAMVVAHNFLDTEGFSTY